jgi:hypothetical protein
LKVVRWNWRRTFNPGHRGGGDFTPEDGFDQAEVEDEQGEPTDSETEDVKVPPAATTG